MAAANPDTSCTSSDTPVAPGGVANGLSPEAGTG